MGVVAMIVHCEVPRTIQELRIGQGLHEMAMPIDHLEGALADHVEHTVRSRHIADDYESIAEHPESRAQSRQAAGKKYNGGSGRSQGPSWPQLHDSRARALHIGAAVEIAHENIAGGDGAASGEVLGNEGDTVGVDIAIGWNSRRIDDPGDERVVGFRSGERRPEPQTDGNHDSDQSEPGYLCVIHL